MHSSEIDIDAKVEEGGIELEDDHLYGYRPVTLEWFAPVDGTDVIIPCDSGNPESMTVAFTEEQAMQAIVALAAQVGKGPAVTAIKGDAGI